MSASRLREAAGVLRSAAAAVLDLRERGVGDSIIEGIPSPSMGYLNRLGFSDPTVGLALAEWMDQHAHEHGTYGCGWITCQALAVVDEILGAGDAA